jgi:excisionase family DNA binding protein
MSTGTGQAVGLGVGTERADEGVEDPFEMLTAEEVGRWLRMTPAWVWAQTRANNIPHVRLGRYVRYRRSAVKAWMTEIERGSPAHTFTRVQRRRM